jgi:hypothetical protein
MPRKKGGEGNVENFKEEINNISKSSDVIKINMLYKTLLSKSKDDKIKILDILCDMIFSTLNPITNVYRKQVILHLLAYNKDYECNNNADKDDYNLPTRSDDITGYSIILRELAPIQCIYKNNIPIRPPTDLQRNTFIEDSANANISCAICTEKFILRLTSKEDIIKNIVLALNDSVLFCHMYCMTEFLKENECSRDLFNSPIKNITVVSVPVVMTPSEIAYEQYYQQRGGRRKLKKIFTSPLLM